MAVGRYQGRRLGVGGASGSCPHEQQSPRGRAELTF